MKTLYILRHGKASAGAPGGADRDRALSPRGHGQTKRLGAELAYRGWRPALALVSPARRARETFAGVAAAFAAATGGNIQAREESTLYLAPPAAVLEALCAVPASTGSVLVIGHNPGLHELALALAGARTGQAGERLRRQFPTAALAAFEFDGADWTDVVPHRVRLAHLILPKDLD